MIQPEWEEVADNTYRLKLDNGGWLYRYESYREQSYRNERGDSVDYDQYLGSSIAFVPRGF